jgi:thymidylate synthase (FAD)
LTKLIKEERIGVLDKGYVRIPPNGTNLVKPLHGDDSSAVNAARASFMKESLRLTDADIRLLTYLALHGHTSPYRHATVTLEVKAPFMIARQWFKYRIGWEHGPDTAELVGVAVPEELAPYLWDFLDKALAWVPAGDDQGFNEMLYARNEASRRYVTMEPEFYVPGYTEWRSAPENKKQGSGDPLPVDIGKQLTSMLKTKIKNGLEDMDYAMRYGVAPEMARGFIDCMYFMYTVWRWTASVQGVAWFIYQRAIMEGAQDEITEYALATWQLIKPYFPHSLDKITETGGK